MLTIAVTVAVLVLTGLLLVGAVRARRVHHVRAAALVRQRYIEREQRLADLRIQRALQDTVQALFDATRGPR